MIDDEGLERINQVQEERWLAHPYAVRILEELELVYRQPKISGSSIGRAIIGRSGAGKTTVLKHFVKEHENDGGACPPLFINVPGPNLNELFMALLRAVNDFKPGARSAGEKFDRVIRIYRELKPPIIIFDEAQTLTTGTTVQARACLDKIKELTNVISIPTVLAGTNDLIPIIRYDDQYVRRWRPVKFQTYPEGQDFVDLVNAIMVAIPLRKQEGFLAPSAYQKLYKYSEGVFGLLKEVLINATTEAIRDGTERLTINHIRPIMDLD